MSVIIDRIWRCAYRGASLFEEGRMAQIGQQIEGLRIKLGMNQTDFGALFGVSAMAISRWERSVNQPDSRELFRLGLLAREVRMDGWSFWRLAGLTRATARAML